MDCGGSRLSPRQRIARMLLYGGGGVVMLGLALMPMHLTLGWPSWTVSLAGFLAIAGFAFAAIGSFFSGYLSDASPSKSRSGEEKP